MNAITRDEWLALRNTGIGGSDAGTVLGVNPYKTEFQLYLEKRGEIEPDDISEKESVLFGNLLEDVVAQEYARRSGNKVERCNTMLRHPEHGFILGNLDRLVWQGDKRPQFKGQIRTNHLLECKTALGRFVDKELWGPDGTDEVPMSYLAQCQHYLAVTDAEICDLAVLLSGPEFRIYHIQRDNELIEEMIAREAEFWARVTSGNAPAPDYDHATTAGVLAKLYPGTNGQEIELPDAALHWQRVMADAKEQVKFYEGVADGAKNHLLHLMGEAAVGHLPDGAQFTRKAVQRGAYAVDAVTYIDFRFKKSKEKAA
ncbi:YqaJ viral recombinase family protein [Paludibacterium purpuratum]|uniref:Putative phage-type endonuclease n=1 Tax=Paludibacterium purpuratum TaxID=1144873 RepID=A0A4R7BDB7_9NEIS|nr:YqaJ viral recombinase family protein [Paludibacterium purpuratum]TDR82172.1 putative phage-type endonuclease [Paludibacterium purpuratum]